MGAFANGAVTRISAWAATVVVLTLNFFLIAQTLGVAIPGLPDAR
jgi:Mn2+/Fe2+ NRAMP family transporter